MKQNNFSRTRNGQRLASFEGKGGVTSTRGRRQRDREYDDVTVSTVSTDLTKKTVTVPEGFDHNDAFKALRKFEQSVLQEGRKVCPPR